MGMNDRQTAALFEYLFETLVADGGDGDVALVIENHAAVADQFRLFLVKRTPNVRWAEQTQPTSGDIVFWADMESFIIAGDDHFCSYLDGVHGIGYPIGKIPTSHKVVVR